MHEAHSESSGDVDALWEWNLLTGRAHFSPRWLALLGHDADHLGTTSDEWLRRVHPDDVAFVQQEIARLRSPGSDRFEFSHRMRHNDGTCRWILCRGNIHRNELGEATRLTGSHTDITVDVVMDPVTRLPNRLLLLDHISRSITRGHRQPSLHYAVVVFELRQPSGDAGGPGSDTDTMLLQAAARRLETCLRGADPARPGGPQRDLVARLDGDCFGVLIEGLRDVAQAEVGAKRLLRELLSPFTMNGTQVFPSISAGVAVSATGYSRPEEMLRDAETAVHRARVIGGSRCELFDTSSLDVEVAESQLETDLAAALDRHELRTFYQPIIDLASHRIIGFEALVRWQHPSLGLLLPARFISLSEKTGAILPLSRWVLREACTQLSAWRAAHPSQHPLWVSVNLSAPHLRHPGLLGDIVEALRESTLDPRHLVLELTEGIAIDNPDAVKTVLMQLRAMGVRISIDDFGTGYSSLGYLRQLPIDTLKIDRSFVHGMEDDPERSAIVGTLLTMARQLELTVVAEGVENHGQVGLLRSLGCESVQGYLFAKPLDATAATRLLQAGAISTPPAVSVTPGARHSGRGRRAITMGGVSAMLTVMLLIVLASLGVPSGRTPALPAPSPTPPHGPRRQAPPKVAPPVAAVTRTSTLARVSSDAAASPRVPRPTPTTPGSRPRTAEVSSTTKADGRSARIAGHAVVPPSRSTPAPRQRPGEVATLQPAAAAVAHDHVFGSCHGLLEVSGAGLRFTTDNASDTDGFLLPFGSFRHELRGETLTIKTSDRDYRFRASTKESAGLRSVAAVLAHRPERMP